MGVARIQMTWLRDNGLTEDVVSNTWYATESTTDPVSAADAEDLAAALDTFYDSLVGHFAGYMAGTRTFKVYDMQDSEPRVPVYEESLGSASLTQEGLPAQLAACLSFSAAPSSGVAAGRRRGRIYLGPLSQPTLDGGGGTGDRRINTTTLDAIDNAYVALATAWDGIAPGWFHAVYSPTIDATGTLAAATNAVTRVYVDNSYDVLRSRASRTTTRQVILP